MSKDGCGGRGVGGGWEQKKKKKGRGGVGGGGGSVEGKRIPSTCKN